MQLKSFAKFKSFQFVILGLIALRFILFPILTSLNFYTQYKWINIAFDGKHLMDFTQEMLALALLVYWFEAQHDNEKKLLLSKQRLKEILLEMKLQGPHTHIKEAQKLIWLFSEKDADLILDYTDRIPTKMMTELTEEEKKTFIMFIDNLEKQISKLD